MAELIARERAALITGLNLLRHQLKMVSMVDITETMTDGGAFFPLEATEIEALLVKLERGLMHAEVPDLGGLAMKIERAEGFQIRWNADPTDPRINMDATLGEIADLVRHGSPVLCDLIRSGCLPADIALADGPVHGEFHLTVFVHYGGRATVYYKEFDLGHTFPESFSGGAVADGELTVGLAAMRLYRWLREQMPEWFVEGRCILPEHFTL